jgi:hypothetical protein
LELLRKEDKLDPKKYLGAAVGIEVATFDNASYTGFHGTVLSCTRE